MIYSISFWIGGVILKNDNSNIAINKIKEVDIVFKSILVGLAAGSVSIVYRIALSYAEKSS